MTTPTNHTITITLGPGQHVRGKVVYLQPKAERWRPQSAVVHITTSDWIELYGYQAIYRTSQQTISGRFVAHRYGWEGNQ